jgi:hypothetical protein
VSIWWLPIAGGVGAIIAALIGLALFDIGPFSPSRQLEPIELDEGRYAEERMAIELTDVATSTTAPPAGGRIYTASQIVDQNPTTAWRSRPFDPEGRGAMVDLFLGAPAWVELIMVHNGDHYDADAYEASARVQRALVTLDGGEAFMFNLVDHGRVGQAIELPRPILTTTVRIEVLEVFPGATNDGVAISDIELFGRLADDVDAELARERAGVSRAAG